MRIGSKHLGVKVVQYVDFTGGLNFSVPPDALALNEAQMLLNWEYDFSSGVLKTRDGLKKLGSLTNNIDQLYYAKNLGVLLVSAGGKVYKYNNDGTFTELGVLSGSEVPVFAEWSDKVLIASGNKLQSTDGSTLTTIDTSPLCDYVNVQYGRVIVSKQGDDYLYWSGIGDETNWNFSGTDSDALQLEVGYKDGGNIVAVKMLAKDIIVFKDNKRIYRIVGVYPDWVVYNISKDNGALSRFSAIEIGNSLAFIDKNGIKSLDTVLEYGDIKVRDAGEKINIYLAKNLNPAQVRLWHIRPKGQIWIKGQNDNFIYVFHYFNKAWTMFQFRESVTAVAYDDKAIYVALGTNLYQMDGTIFTDDGQEIQARIITKKIHSNKNFLLKRGKIFYRGLKQGTVNLKINKLYKQIDLSQSGDIAYLDTDIAYSDDDPVVQPESSLQEFRCNHRLSYLQPEIVITSGALKFYGLILEVVEV